MSIRLLFDLEARPESKDVLTFHHELGDSVQKQLTEACPSHLRAVSLLFIIK